jgi:aldehyde dehydrogenase
MTNHALDTLTPGSGQSPLKLKSHYDNFIGGKWVAPVEGGIFYQPNTCHWTSTM